MNVQNVSGTKLGMDVRRAFVPKLDAFLFFDYVAVEIRLLAYYMATIGDLSLASELKEGLDPHLESAKGLFPSKTIDPSSYEGKQMRNAGKILNFSIQYGGGVPTIMRQLKCGRGEAASLLKAYHQARPGIKVLKEAVWQRYQEVGYIRTIDNRQLHPQSQHLTLNALIQGSASELMRDALAKIHNSLSLPWIASHIVNTIHDDVQLDVLESEIPELVRDVPALMGNAEIEKVVPIEVSIELSRTTWADKTEFVVCGK